MAADKPVTRDFIDHLALPEGVINFLADATGDLVLDAAEHHNVTLLNQNHLSAADLQQNAE